MAPDTIPAPTAPRPDDDAPWRIAGLPAPLSGDPRRQAVYPIQGYVYQAWWSIDAWLRLTSPEEVIYLEGAEDLDIVKPGTAITVQVKKHTAAISLGAEKAHEALENYWILSSKNPRQTIHFHYLTTSSAATEQNASFDGLTGIEAWRAAQTNPELTVKVATYLREKLPATSSLRAFLATAAPDAVQEHLIRRFHWLIDQPNIEAVKRSVNDRICVLLSNRGRSVSLSSSVQKYLESHFWEIVIKPSLTERCLTHAELLRQIEAATTAYLPIPFDQLPGLIGTAPPGLNLLLLLTEKAPKPPDPLLKRPSLTQRLGEMVKQRRTVLLTGTVYKGKTTLAQLVASALCPEAWWINVTERRPIEADNIFLALATRIEGGNCPSLVIIDDLDVSSGAHRVYKDSLALVLHRAKSTGRSVILTAQGASSNSAIVQDFGDIELLDVPELSTEETAMLCHEHGCPESLTKMWASLVTGTTSGHPKLVQVRISELMSRGWPQPGPDDFFAASSAITSARQSAKQLLSGSVPGPMAEFVYMVSECSVLMHRTIAMRLAESINGITTAGDVIDTLTGRWLERIEGNWLRATALLKGVAAEVWSPEKYKQIHIRLHDAIWKKGTLDPWEAAALLFHAFVARDKARLTHTAMRLQTIENHDARHEVERQLLWLPLVALEAGKSLTGDAVADTIIRQLQFRVASTLDSDTLPDICERWIEGIKQIPLERRSIMSGVMWFSFGFSQSLQVPLKHRLRAIASIETLPSEFQDFHRERTRALLGGPEIVEAGIPTTATTAQMMFLFTNRSVRDAVGLEQLLQWLDEEATDPLRKQFEALLEWPIAQAVGAFVQSAWAAKHEETSDWGPWIRLLEKIDDYAKRRASPRFGREAAKARAIILTEYLERSNEALAVLDQAVHDFGPSPVLLEQRANVFWHKQDDERVLGIWTQLVADPASKSALDMFAYRRAGISAARLKRWNDAEQIFQDAITSIPPGQFELTKFGLQIDAAFVAALQNNHSQASKILAKAVLSLPAEAATEGDLRWDAVHRTAVEVCKTIENSFWKHEKFDPRIKVGDASSPNLKSHKVEPGQLARYELMRVQVLHLAATLGVDHPSITEAIEQLAKSRYVYVRWLAAEARLALAYANGAGVGFIRALVAFEKSYADLSGKRGALSLITPDQGPASNLPIALHEWFGLLAAGSICAGNNLLSSLNSWLNESIQEVESGTPLTDVVRSMIEGASKETDHLEIILRPASNPVALRCGAAARLLCSELDASKTFQLQAFLTSALVSDKSFTRQDLFNLHVARRFAEPWRAHAENRFQFSCPRTTVPQLLHAVDGVTKGTCTLKDLLQSAGNALGRPLGDFMERVR